MRAIVRLEREQIFAIHGDLARAHVVIRMTGHDFGKRAFPRAVWAHHGVHFATGNGQTQAAHDLLIANGHMEVFDTKLVHKQELEIYGGSRGLRTDFRQPRLAPGAPCWHTARIAIFHEKGHPECCKEQW